MVLRGILLSLLIPAIAWAADEPQLIKASVALPLLRQFKIKDTETPGEVLIRLNKILGETRGGDAGGPNTYFHAQFFWLLDDGTTVTLFEVNNKLVSVDAKIPGKGDVESFYYKAYK